MSRNQAEGDRDKVDGPSKWLQSPAYVPGLMPPQRREWFARFIERTYAFVSDPDRTNEAQHTQLKSLEFVIKDMLRRGVVVELLSIMCMAHDPDGKEVRRGWQYGAHSSLELIATEDLREILMDAIETSEMADWLRYPAWFGTCRQEDAMEVHRYWRGRAVKFYPNFSRWHPAFAPDEIDLMERLLDDPEAIVRWSAALIIVEHAQKSVSEKVIGRLIEATADHKWIWSSGDYFDDFSTGAHAAVTALGKVGRAAFAALPEIRKLIAEEELERRTLVSGHDLEANPWVESRLARLSDAVQRIEQSP